MATYATGAGHRLLRAPEATWGTTASSGFSRVRHTGCDLDVTKDVIRSNEIRNDRQRADVRLGVARVTGGFAFELSNGNFDDIIETALFGKFAQATTTPFHGYIGTFSMAAGTGVLTGPSSWTTGLTVGDAIFISGFVDAANNGLFYVQALTTTTVTLAKATAKTTAYTSTTAETDVASVAVHSATVAGTKRSSMTFERGFMDQDTPSYALFSGVMFDTMALSIKPSAIVTGTVTSVGKGVVWSTTTAAGTFTEADYTVTPYDTFSGVLLEGGTSIGCITSVDFNIKNNLSPAIVVGSKVAQGEFAGRIEVTGSVEAYFADITMLNKFLNETNSSIQLTLGGALGTTKTCTILVPKIKYTGSTVPVNGDGPITLKMPFESVLDSVNTMTTMVFARMNA